VKEEQATKDIMMGLQKTTRQMLGTKKKIPNYVGNIPSTRGGSSKNFNK
jgi:hypothetical protein